MKSNDSLLSRSLFVIGGLVFLLMTAAFYWQAEWATALWLWPAGRLSFIFLSSITAAVAAPMIWIGLTGEFRAAMAGAINLGITALGTAVYLFLRFDQEGRMVLLISGAAATFFLAVNAFILWWSSRQPIQDKRITPRFVKVSFAAFTFILVIVSGFLIFQAPVIFPWPLQPQASVIFGFIFLGAACYFATALASPWWHSARGQLIGFLAYDLVLIGPFLNHLTDVNPAHRLSLILYLAVLVFSGAIAVYYLFVNESTRQWRIQAGSQRT